MIDAPRRHRLDLLNRAALEGIVEDLSRKAQDLSQQELMLVVMLMGGTGVGKSTLLNALARATIARASAQRPTTKEPVVYLHESIPTERLDPTLRLCHLQRHRRDELRQKIIVDTPDLDSTERSNVERLRAVLPVADIVIYVGSQEKYHDKLGWDLFLAQRRRRAFAFVLNKWDRCMHPSAVGVRPDVDWLRDLSQQGFSNPVLFRTSAARWIERADGQPPPDLPEGEQFAELVRWLELGLTQLEIEAVKARGVVQSLGELERQLHRAMPPDLTIPAQRTTAAWGEILRKRASDDAEFLVNALEPSAYEIEQHFRRQADRFFKGPMLWWLKFWHGDFSIVNGFKRLYPFSRASNEPPPTNEHWNLRNIIRTTVQSSRERALNQRLLALGNQLLVQAEENGFPLQLLDESVAELNHLDWSREFEEAVSEALHSAERIWEQPSGVGRWVQKPLIAGCNVLPWMIFLGSYLLVIYRFFFKELPFTWLEIVAPFIFTLIVLPLLHFLIKVVLPVRWSNIRMEFRRQLRERLEQSFLDRYSDIPTNIAEAILKERREFKEFCGEVLKVRDWLCTKEQSTRVAALYGSEADDKRASR